MIIIKGSKNLINLFRSAHYRIQHRSSSFPHYGLQLFIGEFGSGKTLSSVNMITDILDSFPNCILVSNVEIHSISNKHYYIDNVDDFLSNWVKALDISSSSSNSFNGVILFIDEVQVFLAKILNNPSSEQYNIFITILGQLRKLNCLVVLTSQLYNKVQKCLRDYIIQNGQIVTCKKLIPGTTYYGYYDMSNIEEDSKCKLKGKIRRFDITIHSPELYQCYDSFKPVVAIKGLLNNKNEVKNDE